MINDKSNSLTFDKLKKIHEVMIEKDKEFKYDRRFFTPFSKNFNNTFFVHPNFEYLILTNPEFAEMSDKYRNTYSIFAIKIVKYNKIPEGFIYYQDYRDEKVLHPLLDVTKFNEHFLNLVDILLKHKRYEDVENFFDNWKEYQDRIIKLEE